VAVQVDTSSDRSAGVPISVAQSLSSVPGVAAVQLSASSDVVVIAPDGKKVKTGGAPSEGNIWRPAGQSVTAPPTLVSGSAPTGPDQVVINDSAAKNAGLKVGDQLKISTLKDGALNVTLSGIYKISTDTGGYVGVLFDQQRALQLFTDGSHVSLVRLAADPGVSQAQLRSRVAAAVPSDLRVRTGDQVRTADENSLQRALSFVNIFLLAFGGIALLVGTFIIYNTFSMIVAQRLRELALLRAIGADRGQVLRSVLGEGRADRLRRRGYRGGGRRRPGPRTARTARRPGPGAARFGRRRRPADDSSSRWCSASASPSCRRPHPLAGPDAYHPSPPCASSSRRPTAASLRRRNIIGGVLLALGALAAVFGATSNSAGTAASFIGPRPPWRRRRRVAAWRRHCRAGSSACSARSWLVRSERSAGWPVPTRSANPRRTAATAFALTLGLMLVSGIAVIGSSPRPA